MRAGRWRARIASSSACRSAPMPAVMRQIAPHLAPGCILSDAGSTKGSVIRDLKPLLPAGVHLVPAHPMAGTEHSGPDAGFAELFENRYVIVTPVPGGDAASVERIAEFWRRLGSMVERMDAETHDKVVAIVSPPAAPDRLHHLRHGGRPGGGDARGGAALRRLRLPRLHPHRVERRRHVARHLPEQPRRAAGDAGAASPRTAMRWRGRCATGRRTSSRTASGAGGGSGAG